MNKIRYREMVKTNSETSQIHEIFYMLRVRQVLLERQHYCQDQSSSVPGSYTHALSTQSITQCLV